MVSLSIIVTCFGDSEQFYKKNLRTLLHIQSRNDIELLVVNTGGDKLPIFLGLMNVISNCENMKLVPSQMPLKQGPGRNLGMQISEGKYLWFIDSDDEFLIPDEIILRNISCDIVSFNYKHETRKGLSKLVVNGSNGLTPRKILYLLSLNRLSNACWPYYYKAVKFKKQSQFENYFFEDLLYNFKSFSLRDVTYEHMSTNLYLYRFHPKSTSRSKSFEKLRDRWNIGRRLNIAILTNSNLTILDKCFLIFLYTIYHRFWVLIR